MCKDYVTKNKKEEEIPEWERNVVGIFVLPCKENMNLKQMIDI
ncbi:MAG: hypothetical protein AB1349_14550 [Elusimicrobiota bacterium]